MASSAGSVQDAGFAVIAVGEEYTNEPADASTPARDLDCAAFFSDEPRTASVVSDCAKIEVAARSEDRALVAGPLAAPV